MWKLIKDILWDNPHRKWFLGILFIINILGSIYGYWWYHDQLAQTAAKYWFFVPDSPRASTLFSLAVLILLSGRRWPLFELWAYFAVMKYGVWAVVMITDYWLSGGVQRPTEWMLWLSHGGMALEGFFFMRHLHIRLKYVVMLAGWMLLNDYLDYAWGLHPYFFSAEQGPVALTAAVLLTSLLIVISWYRAIK